MSILKNTKENDSQQLRLLQPMVPCDVFRLQLGVEVLGKNKCVLCASGRFYTRR